VMMSLHRVKELDPLPLKFALPQMATLSSTINTSL
jgi:hypothetical protein